MTFLTFGSFPSTPTRNRNLRLSHGEVEDAAREEARAALSPNVVVGAEAPDGGKPDRGLRLVDSARESQPHCREAYSRALENPANANYCFRDVKTCCLGRHGGRSDKIQCDRRVRRGGLRGRGEPRGGVELASKPQTAPGKGKWSKIKSAVVLHLAVVLIYFPLIPMSQVIIVGSFFHSEHGLLRHNIKV